MANSLEMVEEFLADSNEALNLNLVRAGKDVFEEPFNPAFTYSIFGDDEKIFGYSDLQLNLRFRAHDLDPSFDIQYDQKWQPIGETKAMDLNEMLKDFLIPEVLNGDKSAENGSADSPDSKWTPPGRLIKKYAQGGRNFEIWCGSLADPKVKQILKNMQVLVPLYIEGGTLQNLDDQDWTMERWKLFLLYENTPLEDDDVSSPYTFAGFATSYRLWVFPTKEILALTRDTPAAHAAEKDPVTGVFLGNYSPLDAPSRERISQFIIIPPFQGQAHGSHLYNTMMSMFLNDKNVFEVTVEDPNEVFDDLRDWCDLARLRQNPTFASITIADSVPDQALSPDAEAPSSLLLPQDKLTKIRHASKIVPRQFHRLVEMHTLSQIPPNHRKPARLTRKHKAADANDRRYYFWRHLVKERLYNHNRDQLMQIDADERVEKIEAALAGVEAEYESKLEVATRRAANGEGRSEGGKRIPAKRKAVIEDDEDDDDEEEDAKKARVDA
ncbi:putative histone acetyltransferase type b catalytic subunit protein [Neofusicoccum parvum]|uniref:Histone acetyltransferase type B catalytic subunit n=2 Tax=Neofusicoccum parvum TaxID=310453 RepID=R1GZP5_BOTPV|nr:putative histone acetyltransferase type b catalytic subunit protein [Neofusicoccum parvum UCRNP2]GME40854.1 putative histone acetyltransferase type b catalytic subunit protein [Neofusicoccum parvum]GME64256.1 putative histone acetyltransferase type b catalytic subunit protein [Neofusicoccum parvum]